MNIVRHSSRLPRVLGVVLLLALVGGLLGMWRVPSATTAQRQYSRTIGELTGDREVGQLFESIRPALSAVAFQIATYGGRDNTHDVIFELRERVDSMEPLRRVTVSAHAFHDHQLYTFSFPEIADSGGKTYYASLRSPESTTGNAITLDYSPENPYQKGTTSMMVVLPKSRGSLSTYDGTIKTNADLTFLAIHQISALEFTRLTALRIAHDAWIGVVQNPSRAWSHIRILLLSMLLAVVAIGFRGRLISLWHRRNIRPVMLSALLLIGLLLRLLYVDKLPYTNDEGFYLYDARTVLEGRLPGGDALAKAPIVVAAFAAGIGVFGNVLTAARLVSVISGLSTALFLFVIARRFASDRTGVIAAGLWLLASAPALFTAYGHTQAVQMALATAAIAAAVVARERTTWPASLPAAASPQAMQAGNAPTKTSKMLDAGWKWWLAAGALAGLSVVARKSSLALALPLISIAVWGAVPLGDRIRRLLLLTGGGALVLTIFFAVIFRLYGAPGVLYATGFDLAKTSIEQLEDRGDLYATYSIKGILPLFRESLPLIFLALAGLGVSLEKFLFTIFRKTVKHGAVSGELVASWGARLAWLLPLVLAWRGGVFVSRFEEEGHFAYGLWPFWITMSVALVVLALIPRRDAEKKETNDIRSVGMATLWFLAVGLFYAFWVKFHANYLLEFLPALTLVAAVGAAWLTDLFSRRRILTLLYGALMTWASFTSTMIGYEFPHTGTFHWSSIVEAADILRRDVPREEPVLTGAVIIPYLSGHRVLNDVAHPTWYGYGYIEPELRNVFMASSETMVKDVQERVRWAIRENVTDFSYLREYTPVEKLLETSFEQISEIENLGNTIRIFRRKDL